MAALAMPVTSGVAVPPGVNRTMRLSAEVVMNA
jgi:hypothetical protein